MEILKEIKKLSQLIIKTALPIMEDLIDDNNDFVEDVLEENNTLQPEEVANELRTLLEELTKDADAILPEINDFQNSLGNGTIEENKEKFPHLYEIWSGDAFGESEERGLNMLVKDLELCLADLDEDNIINNILDKL